MNLDDIKTLLPDYAKDLRLNLDSVLSESGAPGLNAKQIAIIALASAIASRHVPLTTAVAAHVAGSLSEAEANGARAAAAIMAMNNIYFRFLHLSSNPKYATMPAKLRMNVLRTHGADAADFELWSIAERAINGCGKCVDDHENVLWQKGVTGENIAAEIRGAADLNAIETKLDAATVTVTVAVSADHD